MAISCAVWAMSSTGLLTLQAGIFLIFCLVLNTIWEINTINEKEEDTKDAEPEIEEFNDNYKGKLNIFLRLISGIILLSFGSNILVDGSQTLATLLGVNEIVIGLTIVATGTSLPELVTSIIAAFKGKTDLAIGNVIGSNLLNQLLILGSCSIFSGFKGLEIEQSLIKVDMPFMVLTTFACLPIFWSKGKITRVEGFVLLNLYIFYILDKILFLNGFSYLSELRIGLFIYFSLLIFYLFVQEKLQFFKS
jgi:cation:H+ antiporter